MNTWVALSLGCALVLALSIAVNTLPETVTERHAVCPPVAPERIVIREPALVKDCEFSDPCTFRSIYDYQRDVRSLKTDVALSSIQ